MKWKKCQRKAEHIKAFQVTRQLYNRVLTNKGDYICVGRVELFAAKTSIKERGVVVRDTCWVRAVEIDDWVVDSGSMYSIMKPREFKKQYERGEEQCQKL